MNAPAAGDDAMPAELARENAKLKKIVGVLMSRVERSTDAQGSAFSLFQAAITLESTVRQRTAELQSLNRRLQVEIEERRAAERALSRAKAEAERANAGKTAFLAAASHDLLQPLNVARLFVEALADRNNDAETGQLIERVGRSLESADALLRALTEMARLDAGALRAQVTDVALDPLLRFLADEYGLAAEERGLRLRIIPCAALVRSDRNLLERVLRNLLANAIRYTRSGGILVGTRRRGATLRIEVWDTGCGIAEANLRDIFGEFFRLEAPGGDDAVPAMGLGLAIVERIAPLIGARIDVRSRLGRGTMFGLTVPLAVSPGLPRTGAPADAAAAPELGALAGRTLLVVDDDFATLEGVCTVLAAWGIDAIPARTLDEAVALSYGRRVRPAAILADYHLADGRTGFDVIDALHASFAGTDIPAIVMTADTNEVTRRSAVDRGIAYLTKPLRVERLRSLLVHLLAAE